MRQGQRSRATNNVLVFMPADGLLRWRPARDMAARNTLFDRISIVAAGRLRRMMADLSRLRRAVSILSVFVLIFSVLALQTATHAAKIDKPCAVEVSKVDSEQVAHHPVDGGGNSAILNHAVIPASPPVKAIAVLFSDGATIWHPCVLDFPTTGPPALLL